MKKKEIMDWMTLFYKTVLLTSVDAYARMSFKVGGSNMSL